MSESKNKDEKDIDNKNKDEKDIDNKNKDEKDIDNKNKDEKDIDNKNKDEKDIDNKNNSPENGEKVIYINKKKISVKENSLTGRQILVLADLDVNQFDLFLVHGQNSEKIESEHAVAIKNGLDFNAILKSVPYG